MPYNESLQRRSANSPGETVGKLAITLNWVTVHLSQITYLKVKPGKFQELSPFNINIVKQFPIFNMPLMIKS